MATGSREAWSPTTSPTTQFPSRPYERSNRSQSISSDRTSTTGSVALLSPPTSIAPEPAFIAATAASQIITNDHETQLDNWLDQYGVEPSSEPVTLQPGSLLLINNFLDQLLFQVLSVSRSTSLAALRAAITDVLKPKLAKDAIYGAEQELNEYLGSGEEEELAALEASQDAAEWDLELVWKRTRLRCMVYSSLGDMEEEDEDYYAQQFADDSTSRFSQDFGAVSPAAAIFLTSILEFVGEQVLLIAGQAAYQRLRAKRQKEPSRSKWRTPVTEPAVVEDLDVEKIALDRTLGRLWRSWRKKLRSPGSSVSLSRSFAVDQSPVKESERRKGSIASITEAQNEDLETKAVPEVDAQANDKTEPEATVLPDDEAAAQLALPIGENDVREIEIPGVAPVIYDEDEQRPVEEEEEAPKARPKTMIFTSAPSSSSSEASDEEKPASNTTTLKRSGSDPLPGVAARAAARLATATIMRAPSAPLEQPDSDVELAEEEAEQEEEQDEKEELDEKAEVESVSEYQTPIEGDNRDIDFPIQPPATIAEEPVPIAAPIRAEPLPTVQEEYEGRKSTSRGRPVGIIVGAAGAAAIAGAGVTYAVSDVPENRLQVASQPIRTDSLEGRQKLLESHPAYRVAETRETVSRSPVSHSPNRTHYQNENTIPLVTAEEEASLAAKPIPAKSELRATIRDVASIPDPVVASAALRSHPVNSPRVAEQVKTPQVKQYGAPNSTSARTDKGRPAAPLRSGSHISESSTPLTPLREIAESTPQDTAEEISLTTSRSTHSMAESAGSRNLDEATPRSSTSQRQRGETGKTRNDKNRPPHVSTASISSIRRKPIRTSEDGTPTDVQNTARSFEELIQSDQTIQYTLTPQNMRDIEFDSPTTARPQQNGDGRLRSSPSSQPSAAKMSGPSTPRSTQSPSKPRSNSSVARDARVNRDSIGDFAEFIRSTGPPGYEKPRTSPAPSTQPRTGSRAGSASASTATITASAPRRSESSNGKTRLQARAAVVPQRNDTSDLIDFIRQGPPGAGAGNRVPRHVAPFRDTMDSDLMAGAMRSHFDQENETSNFGPAYSKDPSKASVNSSINSQTALLNQPSQSSIRPPPGSRAPNMFDEEDGMPKRTRRRVRDPYAIDFSDEDEELEALEEFANTKPKPKQRQEESLIDFLNSVPPPPPPPDPTPLIDPNSEQFKQLKKKASAPSLIARFGRKDTSGSSSQTTLGKSRSTATSPPVPPSVASKFSSPADSPRTGYGSQSEQFRRPSVSSKPPPSRVGTLPRTGTSDLADFLRNSGPPEPPVRSNYEAPAKEGGFRMFGRRKKSTAF